MEIIMVAMRNEKGQFVKKVAETVDPVAVIKEMTVRLVTEFANEVYGAANQRTVLKAYRKIFDASYADSYEWARQAGISQ